jgi:hypothetical protein
MNERLYNIWVAEELSVHSEFVSIKDKIQSVIDVKGFISLERKRG